ncbi:MAG: ComF family protein [Defluviitaleaceae bacterium]|nr:ComF family protein [Defluviitaleaceae bacterium]
METEAPCCSSCYGKTFHFTYNRGAFPYDELIRDMLHEIKFRNKKRVAEGLGELWVSVIKENPPLAAWDCSSASELTFVPMPMHPVKQRERGFNQAEILACALSRGFNVPMEKILIRTEDTPPQAGLHPRLRAENVKDVFSIQPEFDVRGKNYILVDDIYTTGASLNECAKVLISAGALMVLCMTFAITVKNIDKV